MKNFKFNHNWTFWKLIENHAMSHQAKTETERATSERTLISMTDASLAHTAEVVPPKKALTEVSAVVAKHVPLVD